MTEGGPTAARVRGIYATALTRLFLDAGHRVVDASPPIQRRFEGAEAVTGGGAHDVGVETTFDRQGAHAEGSREAVQTARDLLADVAIDAFAWTDPAPSGAVFDGEVTATLGGGAVVDLGDCDLGNLGICDPGDREVGDPGDGAETDVDVEGYLPYGNVDGSVEEGDRLRVQVREPAAPWGDRRAELGTEIRAVGAIASLVPGGGTRVESPDEAAGRELAGMVDLLGIEPPDGWGIVWHRPAVDAGMDDLEGALERVVERAEAIEAATGDPVGDPGRLVSPTAGAWVWYGRECRFALDDLRRSAATTMPGHHRIKAGSKSARAGVDFVEALCEPGPDDPFPFGVVTEQFGPQADDEVRIVHGKPAGHVIVLGEGRVTEVDPDGSVAVKRQMTAGGTYDELDVPCEAGDTALTKFKEGRWWYPTTYRDAEGTSKGTYVNVCTPVEAFPDAVRYVDLHVDVVKHADGTVERVDDDLLDAAVEEGQVTESLAEKARSVASALENAL